MDPTITAAQAWRSSEPHVGAWTVLGAAAQPRQDTGDTAVQRGTHPCYARPGRPRLRLSPSLLPAPAANGDGHGCAAARDTGCHAGIVHGVGSHDAGALGMGVTARQRPAIVTGHCHLTGEKRSSSTGQQRGRGLPIPDGPQGTG